jgi:hypothetical protein
MIKKLDQFEFLRKKLQVKIEAKKAETKNDYLAFLIIRIGSLD